MGLREWPSDDQNLFGDQVDPNIDVVRLSETGTRNRTFNEDGYLSLEFSYDRPDAVFSFRDVKWWIERSNGLLISFKPGQRFDRLLIPWHNIRNFYVKMNSSANDGV